MEYWDITAKMVGQTVGNVENLNQYYLKGQKKREEEKAKKESVRPPT